MLRILLLAGCLLVSGCAAGADDPDAGRATPNAACQNVPEEVRATLRDSIEKAMQDGRTFQETVQRVNDLCAETDDAENCSACVTSITQEVFGQSGS